MIDRRFGGGSSNLEQVTAIKGWVRARSDVGDGVTVMVSELACTEPGCPPTETVIAVLRDDGTTTKATLHCTVSDVKPADIAELSFE